MIEVESSMVKALAQEDEELTVVFNDGTVYRYEGVPAGTAEAVASAESVGSAFWKLVRSQPFPFQRVSA